MYKDCWRYELVRLAVDQFKGHANVAQNLAACLDKNGDGWIKAEWVYKLGRGIATDEEPVV